MIPEVDPVTLAEELLGSDPPFLLDVRDEDERSISCLDDNLHIPMSELPSRVSELDPLQNIVVYCRSGPRSGRVVRYLLDLGFPRVRNLATGINGWAKEVDPSIRTY